MHLLCPSKTELKNFIVSWKFSERPIDLSTLLFEDSLSSQIKYGLLLFTSFSSLCLSCSRILKWGRTPVIQTFFSFKFLKIILLIVTRFLIQSYILAWAVKSLMFQFVSRYEYWKPGQSDKLYREIVDLYYRGLCIPPTPDQENQFCYNIGPDIVTFTQGTLYIPIFFISLLYLPSIFFVLMLSLKSFSLKKIVEKFVEDPVLYLFPIFTSFYFDHTIETNKIKDLGNKITGRSQPLARSCTINLMPMKNDYEEKTKSISVGCLLFVDAYSNDMQTATPETKSKKFKKTQSLPDLRHIRRLSEERCPETSLNLIGKSTKTEEPNFSLLHSNILYLLFFVGSLTCLGADMVLQRAKNKFIRNDTKLFVFFFCGQRCPMDWLQLEDL